LDIVFETQCISFTCVILKVENELT